MTLLDELRAAGLNVNVIAGWETRGNTWPMNAPFGIMHHHTTPPVPYPLSKLDGSIDGKIRCNLNTKPNGEVWIVAANACNFASGPGSAVVLSETKRNIAPPANAKTRGLPDTTVGNRYYFNIENDAPGDGSDLPAVQYESILTLTEVLLDFYGLRVNQVISHAEWTYRKIDPYWNQTTRAAAQIRLDLEEHMSSPKNWDADDWRAFRDNGGWGMYPGLPKSEGGRSAWQTLSDVKANTVDIKAMLAQSDQQDLKAIAKAVNDEQDARARQRLE